MDLAAVLTALYPDARWGVTNNDYKTLRWDKSNAEPKPTLAKLKAAWPQVEADRQVAAIKAERRARYQAETDGMYFDAMRADTPSLAEWQAAVDAIKADLPYPQAPA